MCQKSGNKFEFRDKDLVFDSENVKIVENEINLYKDFDKNQLIKNKFNKKIDLKSIKV